MRPMAALKRFEPGKLSLGWAAKQTLDGTRMHERQEEHLCSS